MCPIVCLPNPLEHITHTYHTENLLEAESSMCTHTLAQTFMLLQDSLHTPYVPRCKVPVHFVFVCLSSSINAPKLKH